MSVQLLEDFYRQIQDEKIRAFTVKCLELVPPEWWKMPASTTGKYHHRDSLGDGGLVRHVQRACCFANILFGGYKMAEDDMRGDIILSALLLHDIGKKENYKGNFQAYALHPQVAAKMIEQHAAMVHPKVFDIIKNCIFYHMGPFTAKSYQKPIEKYTFLELMTYQCDFLSSRKEIDINNGE